MQLRLWLGILFIWSSACVSFLDAAERTVSNLHIFSMELKRGDLASKEIAESKIVALGTGAAFALSQELLAEMDLESRVRLEYCFRRIVSPLIYAWRTAVSAAARNNSSNYNEITSDLKRFGLPVLPIFHRLQLCAPINIAKEAGKIITGTPGAADWKIPEVKGEFDRLRYFLSPLLIHTDDRGKKDLLRRHLELTLLDFAGSSLKVRERAEEEFCMIGAEAESFLAQGGPGEKVLLQSGKKNSISSFEFKRLRQSVKWSVWPGLRAETGLSMAGWSSLSIREKLSLVSKWNNLGGEDAVPVLRKIMESTKEKTLKVRSEIALFQHDALLIPREKQIFPQALLVHFAKIARERGDNNKALDYLEEAYKKNPKDSMTCYELAYTFLLTSRFESSIKRFNEYLSLAADKEKIRFYANQLRKVCGDELAIQYLNWIVERNQRNKYLIYELGMSLLLRKKYDVAIKQFKKTLELSNGEKQVDSIIWYNLACAYSLSEKTSEAVNALLKAIGLGWVDEEHLKNDPDLKNIRSLKEYKKVLDALKKATQ